MPDRLPELHAGRTVGRTLYVGDGPDDLIGIVDTREQAAYIVEACNAYPRLRAIAAAPREVPSLRAWFSRKAHSTRGLIQLRCLIDEFLTSGTWDDLDAALAAPAADADDEG